MRQATFVINHYRDSNGKRIVGGAEVHLSHILNILYEKGFKATIVQAGTKSGVVYKDENEKVVSVRAKVEFLNFFWKKYVEKNSKIIHLNDINFAFPLCDKRTSLTFHGVGWDIPTKEIDYSWAIYNKNLVRFQYALFRRAMIANARFAIKKAKKILSVDTSLTRIAEHEQPNNKSKICTIFNFVDTKKFYEDANLRAKMRRKHNINNSDILILYPRNIGVARGYYIAFQIIKRLSAMSKKYKMLFVGKGLEEEKRATKYESLLFRRLKQSKLMNQCIFLGSIPHDNMVNAYNMSDLVIIPSIYSEGSTLAALEGMACGKPVLTTKVGGLNDIVINGFNGFHCASNSESFVNTILRLHKYDLKSIKKNAYYMVNNIYAYKHWRKQIIDFFDL